MDVSEWLRKLGLEQYAAAFRENAVTADVLSDLTADDLKELGVAAVGHRRRLLQAIAAARADDGGAAGCASGLTGTQSAIRSDWRTPPAERDVLRSGGINGALYHDWTPRTSAR